MAGRVDQERAMLNEDDLCDAANQETAERANPAIPHRTKRNRHTETDDYGEEMDVPMLPHDKPVFLQVVDVIERRMRQELEQKPADVSVKKSFRDVVRIILFIDVFVMTPVFACPHQD